MTPVDEFGQAAEEGSEGEEMKRGYWTVEVNQFELRAYGFTVYAGNGRVIANSAPFYKSKAAAHRAAWRMIAGLSGPVVVKDEEQ